MPATQNIRPDPGNLGFLRALLTAILFMFLSGIILVLGFLAWHYPQFTASAGIAPITLTGNDLYITLGRGDRQNGRLIVNELVEDGTAVISSRRTRFNASNYPILVYKITGRNPGADVVLYWRTVTHNQQTLFAKLHWNSDYTTAYNLQSHPEWKGKITELGISVAGDLRKAPISIEQLTFNPITAKSLLLTVWSEWNAFEGWTQSSINVIKGMPPNALISPVVAAAVWCGLAMLMYSLRIARKSVIRLDTLLSIDRDHPDSSTWNVIQQSWDLRTVVAMFLIAWLALDGKWQVNLWRQLADTKYLFAGKTHHEQYMAADDAELYAYAKRLKEKVLPKEPVRLFILRNKSRDRTRLKLMYYLLPHNIYNYGTYPNRNILEDGDYILVINPIEGLSYSDPEKILRINETWTMLADSIDQKPLAALYKIRNSRMFLDELNINHGWKKDILSGRFMKEPVIIAGTPTTNGPAPGVIAIHKKSDGSIQLRFQEWGYQDGIHFTEQVPFLALESGILQMIDDSIMETGTIYLENTGSWQPVEFNSNFPATPSLFLTAQTSSPQSAVSVRANNVTGYGFEVKVNTQESKHIQPTPVTIAYLAVYAPNKQGTLMIEGNPVSYRLTKVAISNEWRSFKGYDLRLQEETSLDRETKHTSESVDIMMIGGYLFTQVVSSNEEDTVGVRMRKHIK